MSKPVYTESTARALAFFRVNFCPVVWKVGAGGSVPKGMPVTGTQGPGRRGFGER